MARVSGHGLQRVGRAHDENGRYTGAKQGYGICSCGEMSPYSYSTARRKQWYAWHQKQILKERATP